MRLDELWVVTDPTAASTLPDICFRTDLAGLALQFRGGLSMADNPLAFTTQDEAVEEGKHRLLARDVARQIREQRGLPADEVVRVTIHGEGGKVLGEWEVR